MGASDYLTGFNVQLKESFEGGKNKLETILYLTLSLLMLNSCEREPSYKETLERFRMIPGHKIDLNLPEGIYQARLDSIVSRKPTIYDNNGTSFFSFLDPSGSKIIEFKANEDDIVSMGKKGPNGIGTPGVRIFFIDIYDFSKKTNMDGLVSGYVSEYYFGEGNIVGPNSY